MITWAPLILLAQHNTSICGTAHIYKCGSVILDASIAYFASIPACSACTGRMKTSRSMASSPSKGIKQSDGLM